MPRSNRTHSDPQVPHGSRPLMGKDYSGRLAALSHVDKQRSARSQAQPPAQASVTSTPSPPQPPPSNRRPAVLPPSMMKPSKPLVRVKRPSPSAASEGGANPSQPLMAADGSADTSAAASSEADPEAPIAGTSTADSQEPSGKRATADASSSAQSQPRGLSNGEPAAAAAASAPRKNSRSKRRKRKSTGASAPGKPAAVSRRTPSHAASSSSPLKEGSSTSQQQQQRSRSERSSSSDASASYHLAHDSDYSSIILGISQIQSSSPVEMRAAAVAAARFKAQMAQLPPLAPSAMQESEPGSNQTGGPGASNIHRLAETNGTANSAGIKPAAAAAAASDIVTDSGSENGVDGAPGTRAGISGAFNASADSASSSGRSPAAGSALSPQRSDDALQQQQAPVLPTRPQTPALQRNSLLPLPRPASPSSPFSALPPSFSAPPAAAPAFTSEHTKFISPVLPPQDGDLQLRRLTSWSDAGYHVQKVHQLLGILNARERTRACDPRIYDMAYQMLRKGPENAEGGPERMTRLLQTYLTSSNATLPELRRLTSDFVEYFDPQLISCTLNAVVRLAPRGVKVSHVVVGTYHGGQRRCA